MIGECETDENCSSEAVVVLRMLNSMELPLSGAHRAVKLINSQKCSPLQVLSQIYAESQRAVRIYVTKFGLKTVREIKIRHHLLIMHELRLATKIKF